MYLHTRIHIARICLIGLTSAFKVASNEDLAQEGYKLCAPVVRSPEINTRKFCGRSLSLIDKNYYHNEEIYRKVN